ncbi:hypothetical protein DEO23_02875 [Brachybacterium endophyticum]|uniref:Transcriptional regulator, AbiEi antitoxin, Type IV TA system n=1 Tax=Brachybacterium endophyticum TaxID=2182385 RepID=A0A2U2RNW8_9MICO|nr:hypothetical protein [Brachybacterium endophyticum]PWH07588.1 hypothetical protein DEO23_02875 [Brachybacterium endophyticum]
MNAPSGRIAGLVMHRSEWIARGVTARRLASDEFRRVVPGFHTPTEQPASLTVLCRLLQQRVLPGCVISHSTAAVHWGIPLPHQLDDGVGLLSAAREWDGVGPVIPARITPEQSRSLFSGADGLAASFPPLHCTIGQGRGGVRESTHVHRSSPRPTITRSGLALSHPAEVLLQLAAQLPVWDLVAAADALIGDTTDVRGLTLEDLRAYTEGQTARPGVPALRRALTLSRPRVESPGETYARLLACHAGFEEPVPNLPVHVDLEGRTRRVDNGWWAPKVGLEYDGDWRRLSKRAWREDEERREALAAQGWLLRRQNRGDLLDPLPSLLRLRESLRERGARVPSVERIRKAVASLRTRPPALMYRG